MRIAAESVAAQTGSAQPSYTQRGPSTLWSAVPTRISSAPGERCRAVGQRHLQEGPLVGPPQDRLDADLAVGVVEAVLRDLLDRRCAGSPRACGQPRLDELLLGRSDGGAVVHESHDAETRRALRTLDGGLVVSMTMDDLPGFVLATIDLGGPEHVLPLLAVDGGRRVLPMDRVGQVAADAVRHQ